MTPRRPSPSFAMAAAAMLAASTGVPVPPAARPAYGPGARVPLAPEEREAWGCTAGDALRLRRAEEKRARRASRRKKQSREGAG